MSKVNIEVTMFAPNGSSETYKNVTKFSAHAGFIFFVTDQGEEIQSNFAYIKTDKKEVENV